MKEYTKLVNALYTYRTPFELLIQKRYPGASIAVFDINSLMTDIYYHPEQYFASPADVTGQYYLCSDAYPGKKCRTANETLDHFYWYDELHPSEQTDRAIAREFEKVVEGESGYARYW